MGKTGLSASEVARLKGLGLLRNRGTDCFSARIVTDASVIDPQGLESVAEMAERFGSGRVAFTARQGIEVAGIPYEKVDEALAFAAERGLTVGGTGPKIRPVTACKGTVCHFGNCDTQALGKRLHEHYYLAWHDVKLPHKFKICVGGCPNSCMKPSINDFGIEGRRTPVVHADLCRDCKVCQVVKACPLGAPAIDEGKIAINAQVCISCGRCVGSCPFGAVERDSSVRYAITVGGTWGYKNRHQGKPVAGLYDEAQIEPILDKSLLWFRENAYPNERLYAAMERLGVSADDIFTDDSLLERREQILAAPLKER